MTELLRDVATKLGKQTISRAEFQREDRRQRVADRQAFRFVE
jgi:hypothetical protein